MLYGKFNRSVVAASLFLGGSRLSVVRGGECVEANRVDNRQASFVS